MTQRAYEVVEKATQYRTYIVHARTAKEAKAKVLHAENEAHWANTYEDGHNPVIVSSKRAPGYDHKP